MTGIDQSMEVVGALKVFVEQGKLIMADGKFGLDDIRKLQPIYEALKKAKEGSSEIPSELKNASSEEIGDLVMGLAEVALLAYEAMVSSPK